MAKSGDGAFQQGVVVLRNTSLFVFFLLFSSCCCPGSHTPPRAGFWSCLWRPVLQNQMVLQHQTLQRSPLLLSGLSCCQVLLQLVAVFWRSVVYELSPFHAGADSQARLHALFNRREL